MPSQVVTAVFCAVQTAADDRVLLLGGVYSGSSTLDDVKSSTGDASALVAAERAADGLRCLYVDLLSLKAVLEARHERKLADDAAAAIASNLSLAQPTGEPSAAASGVPLRGVAQAPLTPSSPARAQTTKSQRMSSSPSRVVVDDVPPRPPLWHLPPGGVLSWCGDNKAWQAVAHLAAIEMLPEGADTPSAAATLTSKAARLLTDAAADESRVATYSQGETPSMPESSMPPPRLLQRTSTTMTFALPASAYASSTVNQSWMLLGKAFGSGTIVTAANTSLEGTGIALPVSTTSVANVTGLLPNVRYNFAWVWCSPTTTNKVQSKSTTAEVFKPTGPVSASTPAIVASTPAPFELLWSRLAVAAMRASDRPSFALAMRRLSAVFLAIAAPRPTSSEQSSAVSSICVKRRAVVAACPQVQLALSHALMAAALSDAPPPALFPNEGDSVWWPTDGTPCEGRQHEGQGSMSDALAVALRSTSAAPQLAILRRVNLALIAADTAEAVGDPHVVQTASSLVVQARSSFYCTLLLFTLDSQQS